MNKLGAWNKRDGAKFGQFLINVVAELKKLWVENSQKINCRDVTTIREGRVFDFIFHDLTECNISYLDQKPLKNGSSKFNVIL